MGTAVKPRTLIFLLICCWSNLCGQFAAAPPEWNRPVEPFRVVGNVYYVGASDVSAFLIINPAISR
jgi:metallo-beta-lactamase class B